jgi:hypothetical protein
MWWCGTEITSLAVNPSCEPSALLNLLIVDAITAKEVLVNTCISAIEHLRKGINQADAIAAP